MVDINYHIFCVIQSLGIPYAGPNSNDRNWLYIYLGWIIVNFIKKISINYITRLWESKLYCTIIFIRCSQSNKM